jgi:argininosuccinate synthase
VCPSQSHDSGDAKEGLTIFSHGATGRGNDQVRFQLITNMLAPEFEVYAPWRDEEFLARFPGRSEMIDFCEEKGLSVSATKDKPYSTDANLLGLTHESGYWNPYQLRRILSSQLWVAILRMLPIKRRSSRYTLSKVVRLQLMAVR